jgi:hypothetical protein
MWVRSMTQQIWTHVDDAARLHALAMVLRRYLAVGCGCKNHPGGFIKHS